MNRKAFLLGSPMIEGTRNYLRGVTPDIMNMKRHLMSIHGGAWESCEIEVLDNPSRKELFNTIQGEYDFVVFQYSGHGFHHVRNGTSFDICPGQNVTLEEIQKLISSPKRYYFLDCCRGFEGDDMKKSIRLFSAQESDMTYIRQVYREKFNNIVRQCENGTSIVYSCSLNESADEDDDGLGGIFSLSYFNAANGIINNLPSNQYYTIQAVFDLAVARMNNDYPLADQNPVMKPERRNHYFPFVV
jgi:hypothetical protein